MHVILKANWFLLICLFTLQAAGQQINWQNLDLEKDHVFGASIEKAYNLLLKNKKSSPVIIAVIDSGVDTSHEDLKTVLWTNPTDGTHGRNYMGYELGKEDITCLANARKDFFDSLSFTRVPEIYQVSYHSYRALSDDYEKDVRNLNIFINKLGESQEVLGQVLHKMGKNRPTPEDFEQYRPGDEAESNLLEMIKDRLPAYPDFSNLRYREIELPLQLSEYHIEHGLNINMTDTDDNTVNNNRADIANEPLGLVKEPNITPNHGTHVSGILAAARNNGKGMNGVADNGQIMVFKVLNNIREMRDSDLADAIRY